MAGYWVVRGGDIKDEAAFAEYARRWPDIGSRFGAEVVAGRAAVDIREGAHYARQLIVRFPSYAQAVACYEDPEYQEAMVFARKASDRELSILEG